jgi:hypothetical protein
MLQATTWKMSMTPYRLLRPVCKAPWELLEQITSPGRVLLNDAGKALLMLGMLHKQGISTVPYVQTLDLSYIVDGGDPDNALQITPLDEFRSGLDYLVAIPTPLVYRQPISRLADGYAPMASHPHLIPRPYSSAYGDLFRGQALSLLEDTRLPLDDFLLPICLVETLVGPQIGGIVAMANNHTQKVVNPRFGLYSLATLNEYELSPAWPRAAMVLGQFWREQMPDGVVEAFYRQMRVDGGMLAYAGDLFDIPALVTTPLQRVHDETDPSVPNLEADYVLRQILMPGNPFCVPDEVAMPSFA